MVLTSQIDNEFFKYMNLLMLEVYKVFFQNKFPRLLREIQDTLHFSPNRKIGVWFMLEEHNIIRVYGFTHEPYIFLAFLTARVFSLEFIRKTIIVENEHFISFKKDSKTKF